jgi:hypothetical protein
LELFDVFFFFFVCVCLIWHMLMTCMRVFALYVEIGLVGGV